MVIYKDFYARIEYPAGGRHCKPTPVNVVSSVSCFFMSTARVKQCQRQQMSPMHKEMVLLRSLYQLLNEASHLTAFCAWYSGPHLPADEAWYWPKCILRSGWLCVIIRKMWFFDCSCIYIVPCLVILIIFSCVHMQPLLWLFNSYSETCVKWSFYSEASQPVVTYYSNLQPFPYSN